ncbi:MAG: tRNA 2-thiouridine(34) synthase MnmA [Lentimicrobiaceae bacterium]|nr:tRNA 2-thiouridine(34) synthase MnmA [Lentimicrobiaceae bacterium]HPG34291.1 tRNA 2-thiouridine(34) synthase MnmA [Lentimicrobium sp.]
MNIAALVSGGVDSSVMLHLLKEQGYEPVIFYILIGMKDKEGFLDCPSEEDIEITTWLSKKYGLRMEVVTLQEEYWDNVVAYTLDSVKKGLTPNPDVMCNRLIKFGSFNEKYGKDFDFLATGHYASTSFINETKYLTTAKDKFKDQTDFLAQITYAQLQKLMFPVGNLTKPEVRQIANEVRMPSAGRKDSQGICFLGKVNYNDFLRRYIGEKEGNIVELETGKILGKHKGYWFHTIGQRKGLGLSLGPWFVVKKDAQENVIYVSNGYDPLTQYSNTIRLSGFHFISGNPWENLDTPRPVTFKIRHTPDFTKGILQMKNNQIVIESEIPVSGIAAGQFGVVYDEQSEICYGSGEIDWQ